MQSLRAVPVQKVCVVSWESSQTQTLDTILKGGYKKMGNFWFR